MNIKIICVGKLKEKYLRLGISEYMKRLNRFCKLQIIELKDEKNPSINDLSKVNIVKDIEGKRILSCIRDKEFVLALSIMGKQYTSEQLAKYIKQLIIYDNSSISFIIGGSLGLSDAVLNRADGQISFGLFTFPHQLMRLILLEQIYRCFMINSGSSYHK